MTQLITAIVNGLALGVPLFLVASGLTLIYGVMGVLNFAHGAIFALGAYIVASLLGGHTVGLAAFLVAALAGAIIVGALGLASERTIFTRLYDKGHVINLLASYALMLMLDGAIILVFGPGIYQTRTPQELTAPLHMGGVILPSYAVFLVIIGLVVAVALWWMLDRTMVGVRIRAVAHDRVTAAALGVRTRGVGAGVFFLGTALAGLAGALAAPQLTVAPGLDAVYIIQSFIVVIVGGLGSIWGAMTAAIGLGLINSFLITYAPGWESYGMYIAIAIVLLVRPQGLFGRAKLQGA
ncbi:branched-chain amino acid ABC transporter permease [Microbacterium sp. RD1]|uniref:branched-chain amino acid ABC transporter permease n=1 Tax=Microbacterium sp. RD1 TaxID=3457313 RepID=UPI003FA5BCCD